MYVAEVHIATFRHLKDVHIGPLPEPGTSSGMVCWVTEVTEWPD